MYTINKTSSYSAVDYAAEELRKYLRMMMPECGNIEIKYDPDAKDGFRLGLIQDFGLDVSEAEETELDDILYIDTDSIKCLKGHKEEFARANQAHYDMLANHDIDVVVDIEGSKYYIGDWEYEGTYSRFKTLGSKKYFFEKSNGYMELTLAGVNKSKGTKFFKKRGGCDGFNIGVIIPTTDSGRTIAYYNNEPIHKLKDRITGEEFESASNIAIINTTYELGITDEYQELLKVIKGEPL